uniref:hypothetical protein n=1 Tax=Alistipes sp. TaxID=1872444 RepID=UPI004056BFCF
MAIAQAIIHKGESRILKCNLWKFFKTLRVQANPVYCLLVASPIEVAWITISGHEGGGERRVSIAQFILSLKKMPTTGRVYALQIKLLGEPSERTFSATRLTDLSVEATARLLPELITYLPYCYRQRGERLELTPEIIKHYKFKARYLEELQPLFRRANEDLDNR